MQNLDAAFSALADRTRRAILARLALGEAGVMELAAPFKIAAGVLAARRAFRRDRPSVVIGFGGYPTIPALSAAHLMGLPRMIHEQNGVMGRVNRMFAARVHRVACGTWPTILPQGISGQHVGNPVRGAVLDRAASPYVAPGDGALNLNGVGAIASAVVTISGNGALTTDGDGIADTAAVSVAGANGILRVNGAETSDFFVLMSTFSFASAGITPISFWRAKVSSRSLSQPAANLPRYFAGHSRGTWWGAWVAPVAK